MRKITIGIVIILAMVLLFAAMVNAQVSPAPPGPAGPGLPTFTAPSFTLPGFPAVTPEPGPVKMTLSGAEQSALGSLGVGEWTVVRFNLPAAFAGQTLIWSSSNPAVATADGVGNWGVVLGVSPGTATITVSTADGSFSYSFTVVVQ